ncbi:MAG: hypothetical protein IJ048_00335, partial [Clostridia bacterium]|nr:hypothetical protein [Clostridia bacterium]
MKKHSPGKVIAASIAAVVAGLLQVIALPFSIMCVFGTIIAPTLFAWAGIVPALLFLAVYMGSLGGMFAMV